MQVLKFGGTSVANSENISKVISIAKKASEGDKTIVVVSALGGITDMLLKAATLASVGDEGFKDSLLEIEQRHLQLVKQLIPVAIQSQWLSLVKTCCNEIEDICNGIFYLRELTLRTKDRVSGYGEWLSSKIVAAACNYNGIEAVWKDAKELILTNSNYTSAEVDFETTNKNCLSYFENNEAKVFIVPGFIAANSEGITTTLGRGGSDYTASILASAINASHLEIWTDVSGLMTADPRLTSNARIIPTISYQEAMELSHFGAKVIYPPTIQPVLIKSIPIWIKNTFSPDDSGTLITNQTGAFEQSNIGTHIVKGITSIGNISLLTLEGSGMIGIPGFSKRLFAALSLQKINVILITQSSSEHSICVAVESGSTDGLKWL